MHIEKFRFGFQNFEENKFSSARTNLSQECEVVRAIFEDAEYVYMDTFSLSESSFQRLPYFSFQFLTCWMLSILSITIPKSEVT